MRHKIKKKKLNRTSSHRSAMLVNMSNSLVEHEQIYTTLPKAKVLGPYIEKIVTKAKKYFTLSSEDVSELEKKLHTSHIKKILLSKMRNNRVVVDKLCKVLAPRYASRAGGYTRIIKAGFRKGDNAPMSYIQFVDKKENK